jgi:hypothetical protein
MSESESNVWKNRLSLYGTGGSTRCRPRRPLRILRGEALHRHLSAIPLRAKGAVECFNCGGVGEIAKVHRRAADNYVEQTMVLCGQCGGRGWYSLKPLI